jgi:alpha-tubulin suppressor-like RCC1 family protein
MAVVGHGDMEDKRVPTKVEGLDGIQIIKISCGYFHTAALSDKGECPHRERGVINLVRTSMMILDLSRFPKF